MTPVTASDTGIRNSVPVNHECIGCQHLKSLTVLMEARAGRPAAAACLGALSVITALQASADWGQDLPLQVPEPLSTQPGYTFIRGFKVRQRL